jgi:hypothetical protein
MLVDTFLLFEPEAERFGTDDAPPELALDRVCVANATPPVFTHERRNLGPKHECTNTVYTSREDA